MTDKDYKAQRERVTKLFDKWYAILGMSWWRIDREWSREREEDSANTVGLTSCNWEYRTGNITFFLPACADLDDSTLEEAVVHEFVHILGMPIHDMRDDQARQITEHTVTTIARGIIWAYEAGEKTKPKEKK